MWEYIRVLESGKDYYAFDDEGYAYVTRNVWAAHDNQPIAVNKSKEPFKKREITNKVEVDGKMIHWVNKSDFPLEWIEYKE